jgi:hypothetical protein
MKKSPNQPSASPNAKLYDKYEAVEYLKSKGVEIAVTTLFYHNYVSGHLTPGVKHYGRLMWTGAQLDMFIAKNPVPGFKQRTGDSSMTVSEYLSTGQHKAVNEGLAAYYKGQLISRVERDFNHTRRYYIHLDNKTEVPVWNNTRITLQPIAPNGSES